MAKISSEENCIPECCQEEGALMKQYSSYDGVPTTNYLILTYFMLISHGKQALAATPSAYTRGTFMSKWRIPGGVTSGWEWTSKGYNCPYVNRSKDVAVTTLRVAMEMKMYTDNYGRGTEATCNKKMKKKNKRK